MAVVCGWAASSAHASCTAENMDPRSTYIEIYVQQNEPALEFYKTANMNGEPFMELNREGLYIGEEQVCGWPNGNFFASGEPNRVLGFNGEEMTHPCPGDVPVKSGFGDYGKGTAVLCVEITGLRLNSAETTYLDEPLFFSLQRMPENSWRYVPAGER